MGKLWSGMNGAMEGENEEKKLGFELGFPSETRRVNEWLAFGREEKQAGKNRINDDLLLISR